MAHVAVARTKKSGARPPPVIIFVLSRHNPEGHGLLILKLMPRYDLVFFVRVQRDNKLLFDVDVFLHFPEVRVCVGLCLREKIPETAPTNSEPTKRVSDSQMRYELMTYDIILQFLHL